MTLPELHEKLLAWATAAPRQEELMRARRAFFDRCGEPHEEERSFESRTMGMLDYYLYDHRPEGGALTTLERYLADPACDPADRPHLEALRGTFHGLYEVRKLRPGEWVRVRDVFDGQDREVTERRQLVGLDKGDLLEARLLPWDGQLYFSGAFIFHPREVRRRVLSEARRLRKAAGGAPVDVKAFLGQLSRMAQKLERYRNVKVESLYDFTAPGATPPPRPPER
jgi:hypothetical protein